MRDSVTADDLAIESAKQRLVELAERDDYKLAMTRVKKKEKGPIIVLAVMFTICTLSAVGLGSIASGLTWLAVVAFGLLAVFACLGLLGLAQEKPGEPDGVAVVGKRIDDDGLHFVELLKATGDRIDGLVSESEYLGLKAGDIGVAWLRREAKYSVLTELERL